MPATQVPSEQGLKQKLNAFECFGYVPHEKQKEVHLSLTRFRTVAAGARAGKSMLAGAEAAFLLLFPYKHVWFVSSVYDLADKEFDWCLEFLGKVQIAGRSAASLARLSNPARGSRRIEFPWGSWAETKSSQKPESLLGEEIDLIVVGEAAHLPLSAWERQLYPRLGPRRGGALVISTPNWDSGFLAQLYDQGRSDSSEFEQYQSWQFSVRDNPTFPLEEYERARATLPKDVFDEQYDGKFVSRRGLVFPQFSREIHVVDSLPPESESWGRIRCFHHERNAYNNPFVCLSIAIDATTGTHYVTEETYREQADIPTTLQEIVEQGRGKRIVMNLCDHYNHTLQESCRRVLGSVITNNEKKYSQRHSIVRRIQALQTALAPRADGTSRIRILSSCENTIKCFERAKWGDAKKIEAEMAEAEMPATKYLGAPLALSYLVAFGEISRGNNIYEAQRGLA